MSAMGSKSDTSGCVSDLPQVGMPSLRSLVRRALALHDAMAARLRAFAAEPTQPSPDAERAPTVSDALQDRLAVAEQRALDTARMMALLEVQIAQTRAATEAIRAERERLAAEAEQAARADAQRQWLWRRLRGEYVQ